MTEQLIFPFTSGQLCFTILNSKTITLSSNLVAPLQGHNHIGWKMLPRLFGRRTRGRIQSGSQYFAYVITCINAYKYKGKDSPGNCSLGLQTKGRASKTIYTPFLLKLREAIYLQNKIFLVLCNGFIRLYYNATHRFPAL